MSAENNWIEEPEVPISSDAADETQVLGSEDLHDGGNTQTDEPEPKQKIRKGRGRHPKDCDCDKCEAKRDGKETEKEAKKSDVPDGMLDEYEDAGSVEKPVETSSEANAAKYITGYILLIMIDIMFPLAFSYVGKRMGKKNVTIKKLKMSKDEKEELKELADEAAKQLAVNMSPVTLFLLVSGSIYGSKLIEMD